AARWVGQGPAPGGLRDGQDHRCDRADADAERWRRGQQGRDVDREGSGRPGRDGRRADAAFGRQLVVVLMRRRADGPGDRGAVAILVAVFAIVMFAVGALVVDLGVARVTRRDAQNAADSAALAAANA